MKNKESFTLAEVILAATILAFIVVTIVSVLIASDKLWNSEKILVSLQQQTRLALDGMSREIRQSNYSDITVTQSGAKIEFYVSGNSNPISYYLSSNQIIREHPAGTTKILANNITSISFSTPTENNPVVSITVQADKTQKNRAHSFSLTEKIKLRN